MTDDDEPFEPDQPVELPLDGELDLHTFRPAEVKELIPIYLEECRHAGVLEVRIVHGKGKGTLKRIVRAELDKLDWVAAVRDGGLGGGSWGATLVDLEPQSAATQDGESADCGSDESRDDGAAAAKKE